MQFAYNLIRSGKLECIEYAIKNFSHLDEIQELKSQADRFVDVWYDRLDSKYWDFTSLSVIDRNRKMDSKIVNCRWSNTIQCHDKDVAYVTSSLQKIFNGYDIGFVLNRNPFMKISEITIKKRIPVLVNYRWRMSIDKNINLLKH